MTIVVLRQPQLLEDWHFTPVTTLVDLADGRPVDAFTEPAFRFEREAMQVFETVGPPPAPIEPAPDAHWMDRVETMATNLAQSALTPRGRYFRLDPTKSSLTLTPGNCRKLAGVVVAGSLLAHEQAHWDIFFLGARRIAARLAALREVSSATLLRRADAIAAELLSTAASNVNLAQALYDRQTLHGVDPVWQAMWEGHVRRAMADPDPLAVGLAPL